MKRLWKSIPPCLSDTLGFEAVLNQTEGLGIIDDASHYKPLFLGQRGDLFRPHGELSLHDGRHSHGEHPLHDGHYPGGPRRGGPGPGRIGDIRVVGSEIRNEDIIMGTQRKVMQAYYDSSRELHPHFVLLARAPSASMIGSDLETDAECIAQDSGLPAACVNIHGDKDYLYGISVTLEAMGKLLLKKRETVPGTVNLLGCNVVDWHGDALPAAEKLAEAAGLTVLSRWGMKESTENLRKASGASLNWVVNVSGFRLARYMEAEFGIPYIAGAPFGKAQCDVLQQALNGREEAPRDAAQEPPEVLVIGEQLTADAIRRALEQRGFSNIRVLSFYEMDKSRMKPGDAKLTGEDDLAEQAGGDSVRLILADPDYRVAAKRDIPWISLPNAANRSPVSAAAGFNMVGVALDEWLDSRLRDPGKS